MIPFENRVEAGKLLAKALATYDHDSQAVVIALPRGGIPIAYEVATALDLPMDIVYPRKIGAPFNPEFAIGAITESGEGIFNEEYVERTGATEEYIAETIAAERAIAQQRLSHFRKRLPKQDLLGKTAIIVDDGVATGSTMEAAIASVRAEGAAEVVVAVPVGPPDTVTSLEQAADKVIALAIPEWFMAVGQFYQVFDQTTDAEIDSLLDRLQQRRR